jgi:hypothetical protein
MTETDLFGIYVRRRLEEWGQEFALHRDCEYLGHQSKNMLQVLIDHRGEMPPRPTGFKPLEVNLPALQIEFIVSDIAKETVERACILRAFFCGQGRRGYERLEIAETLIRACTGRRFMLGRRAYYTEVDAGVSEVRGVLRGLAMAA